jgi:hypothetical protein
MLQALGRSALAEPELAWVSAVGGDDEVLAAGGGGQQHTGDECHADEGEG